MTQREPRAASEVLKDVVSDSKSDFISFYDIKASLHERGFGLLMLIFAIPVSIPAPVPPGTTMLPGLPLLFFSLQMLVNRDSPWLPKWIGTKKIKRSTLAFLIEKTAKFLQKVEKLMRPRFSFAQSRKGEKLVGFFGVLFSLSIISPIPFAHFIPGLGIVFMSLGLLSRDGIAIILGIIIGNIGLLITVLVVLFGAQEVLKLTSTFSLPHI